MPEESREMIDLIDYMTEARDKLTVDLKTNVEVCMNCVNSHYTTFLS